MQQLAPVKPKSIKYIRHQLPLEVVNEDPINRAATENAAIVWTDCQACNNVFISAVQCTDGHCGSQLASAQFVFQKHLPLTASKHFPCSHGIHQ